MELTIVLLGQRGLGMLKGIKKKNNIVIYFWSVISFRTFPFLWISIASVIRHARCILSLSRTSERIKSNGRLQFNARAIANLSRWPSLHSLKCIENILKIVLSVWPAHLVTYERRKRNTTVEIQNLKYKKDNILR